MTLGAVPSVSTGTLTPRHHVARDIDGMIRAIVQYSALQETLRVVFVLDAAGSTILACIKNIRAVAAR